MRLSEISIQDTREGFGFVQSFRWIAAWLIIAFAGGLASAPLHAENGNSSSRPNQSVLTLVSQSSGAQVPARAGLDPQFRFRASNFYPPAGFFEPTAAQFRLLQLALESCTQPECGGAAPRLSADDFGFVPIDLNRDGVGGHGLLLPRRGGDACTPEGCFWFVLSGNANRWGSIQNEIGFGNYLAVMGDYEGWAQLRIDPANDEAAFYYLTFRRDQGRYYRADTPMILDRIKSEVAQDAAGFDALVNQGAAPILDGPPAGQGRTIRDSRGRVFPTLEYLPIVTNSTGEVRGGRFPLLLERRVASELQQSAGATIDGAVLARDGASPMLRVTREDTQIARFVIDPEGPATIPDIYQLRIFYRKIGDVQITGKFEPIFASGTGGRTGVLLSPAFAPLDPYEWAVATYDILAPNFERFGERNDPLREVTVALGPRSGDGSVYIEKIEFWALRYDASDPLLTPNFP